MRPRESYSEAPFINKEALSTYFADQFKCPDPVLQNCYRSELDEIIKLLKYKMVVNRSVISECMKKLRKKFSRGVDGICGQHLPYGSERILESIS